MSVREAIAKAKGIAAGHAARLMAVAELPKERGVFAAKKDSRGQLYIYSEIGPSIFGGIDADAVRAELGKVKGVSQLDIFMNSEGGSVFQGETIYNLLKRFDARKTVFVDGIAASAASFIAMVGDEIVMAENATMMIHEAHGMTYGTEDDHDKTKALLSIANAAIAAMYSARTGHPIATLRSWMADEKWMSAAEAVELKFADRIDKNAEPLPARATADASPLVSLAAETQRRISAARVRLVDAEQSLLNDRRRASPERSSTQRPAARTQPTNPHGDRK